MRANGRRIVDLAVTLITLFALTNGRTANADYLSALNSLGGLVSHWGMEETSGTAVADLVTTDSIDGDNPGSFASGMGASLNIAGPRPSDGFGGFSSSNSALDFAGAAGQRLDMNPAGYTGASGLTEATLTMWFRVTGTDTTKHVHLGGLEDETDDASGRYAMALNHYPTRTDTTSSAANGGLRVFARTGNPTETPFSTGYSSTPTETTYWDSTWHHAVATIAQNGIDKVVSLYIDGEVVKTDTEAAAATDALSLRNALTFGEDAGDDTRLMVGQLDEIAFFDRAISASEVASLYNTALGLPTMTLTADRLTGLLSLGASFADADIRGYSITSASGALNANPTDWRSISANYDLSGDKSVDTNDDWTILSAENSHYDLSEYEFGGDAGLITAGSSVLLSQPGGSGAWIATSDEDLEATVSLADGTQLDVSVVYTGDGGAAGGKLWRSDFDHDGDIDVNDWVIMRDYNLTDMTGLSEAQRHVRGDIIGANEVNDVRDFAEFMQDYNAYVLVNPGAPSFTEMIQSVPEPSGLCFLVLGGITLCICRRSSRGGMRIVSLATASLVVLTISCAMAPTAARADYVTKLNTLGGLISNWRLEETTGTNVADAVTGDSVDGNNPGTVSGTGVSLNTSGPRPSDGFAGFSSSNSAIDFTGTADQLLAMNVAGYTGASGLTEVTMSAWFRITGGQVADDYFIGGLYEDGGGDRYGLVSSYYDNDDRLRAFARTGNPSTAGFSTTNGASGDYLDSTWRHAVVTLAQSGADKVLSLYVDGSLVDTDTQVAAASDALTTRNQLTFGYDLGTSGTVASGARGMIGQLDELAFFDRALSASEVSDLYAAATGDQFLRAYVHPVSGEIRIRNNTLAAIGFNSYQIQTSSADVNPDTLNYAGWNSLSDQNIDFVDDGADTGETWDEVGGSDNESVAEQFFLGATTLDPGEEVSLGSLYDTSVAGLVSLRYVDVSTYEYFDGLEEYVLLGDMDGNGLLQEADVNPFVQALTDRAAYEGAYDVDADFVGDFNGNGQLDLGDVSGFKDALSALPGAGASTASTVPEPSTMLLMALALISYPARFRTGQRKVSRGSSGR